MPRDEPHYLTVKDMARRVGVSTATIYKAAKEGRLKLHKFEGRTVAKAADFEAYAEAALKPWTPSTKPRKAVAARKGSRWPRLKTSTVSERKSKRRAEAEDYAEAEWSRWDRSALSRISPHKETTNAKN